MIQSDSDKKFNPIMSKTFGMETPDKAGKLYEEVEKIWNSLGLPIDFDEICDSSVRTALSMNMEDGAPMGHVLRGMASHLIIVGYKLAELENSKQRTLN